ncbi:MAG: ParA family protein, partial [Proteobacteria bacterium]|nr:ParA family protein [Pseudomonadota bacterium]
RFRNLVHECSEMFDIVVIDCPPANSHVNIASIFASTHVFIVTTASSDSIDKIGLVDKMVSDISSVISENKSGDDDLLAPKLGGIILTMAVENTVGLDVAQEHLRAVWGDLLISPAIPRTVAASYSVSENVPLMVSKPRTKIALRYGKVFEEVLSRVN